MHKTFAWVATAALLATVPALAQTQQPRTQAAPNAPAARAEVTGTAEFLRMAAMGDRYETASSRLALEKSQNAQVKEFAQAMVVDHGKTTQELQQLMQQVPGMGAGAATPLPQGRETTGTAASGRITNAQGGPQHEGLDQQHAAMLQQLQGVGGAEFDRIYLSQQVTAHQQAVDLFRNYSQSGDNPQLKAWAAQTLPALQQHLQLAQQLQRATQG